MKKLILGICLMGMLYSKSLAYDGQLDSSYGTNGVVYNVDNNFSLADAVIQSDGKSILAGSTQQLVESKQSAMTNIVLERYNVDGGLDTEFGNAGMVPAAAAIAPKKVVLQPDGKIVIGGALTANNGSFATVTAESSFLVARYNNNGSLDTSFGNEGMVVTNVGTSATIISLALQSDGKIVAVGQPLNSPFTFIVARYYNNGMLDDGSLGGTGFGMGGIVTFDIPGADEVSSIAVQEDGKILVAGSVATIETNGFVLVRLNNKGILDTTFGANASVITPFPFATTATNLKIQRDGRILVAGSTGLPNNKNFAVVRYNSNGSLDASFGSGGIVITDLGGDDQVFTLVIQPDGKLIVGGSSNSTGKRNFALTRYVVNGTIDVTFNPLSSTPGTVFTEFDNSDAQVFALALQQNGRILAAGNTLKGVTIGGFALARYFNNNNTLLLTQITSPANNTLFSSSLFTLSGVAQNPSNIGIFADGILIGRTVTSGSANSWSTITNVPLPAGSYVITAVSEHSNGNVNLAPANAVTLVVNDCRSQLSMSIAQKYCPGTLT